METSKLLSDLNEEWNSEKQDVMIWIDHELYDFTVDSDVEGQIQLNVEIEEPEEELSTHLEIARHGSNPIKFKSNLKEKEIMSIFNIDSLKDTYVNSEGFLEFHTKDRKTFIYSNIKA